MFRIVTSWKNLSTSAGFEHCVSSEHHRGRHFLPTGIQKGLAKVFGWCYQNQSNPCAHINVWALKWRYKFCKFANRLEKSPRPQCTEVASLSGSLLDVPISNVYTIHTSFPTWKSRLLFAVDTTYKHISSFWSLLLTTFPFVCLEWQWSFSMLPSWRHSHIRLIQEPRKRNMTSHILDP